MWIQFQNILTIIKQLNDVPIVLLMDETCIAKTRPDYSVRTQNLELIVCFNIQNSLTIGITCKFVDERIYCA